MLGVVDGANRHRWSATTPLRFPIPDSRFQFPRFQFLVSSFPISHFPFPISRLYPPSHGPSHGTCLTSTVPVHSELPAGAEAITRPSRGFAAGEGKITSTD